MLKVDDIIGHMVTGCTILRRHPLIYRKFFGLFGDQLPQCTPSLSQAVEMLPTQGRLGGHGEGGEGWCGIL